ncbi:condensation domain-containing protein [Streptomyces sp. NPDC058612]|uniref:condensation domain-containing protein n=1 Tax=Streptomyces sp. NPDC058612 TaxID=3346555 RepID=UPI0036630BF0
MEWATKIAALSARERRGLEDLMASGAQGLNLFPLSFTQEWVWWNARLKPGTSLYNAPMALRIEGALDTAVLERSFQELVDRHEVLRTSFHHLARTVVQAVEPVPPHFELPVEDLTGLDRDERDRAVERLAVEERSRTFDVTRGHLLRGRLLRLADGVHVLLLTTHHLVTDDWSMRILLGEIVTLYGAFSEGKPSPLAPLPIQYADFAAWQRDYLDDARMEAEFDYWTERLAGAPVPLDMPTDRPRPAGRSFGALVHWFDLPHELSERVRVVSRTVGVTPFMTLMAAFQLWLHRSCGHDTFATSTLTAYRDRAEVANVIGDFGNLVAVPADLRGDGLTFRELIVRVRDAVLETQEHADVPAHRLSLRLAKRREDTHNPISQAMFFSVHAQHSMATLELAGLRFEQIQAAAERPSTPFDVELRHFEQVDGMRMQLLCNADLFDEDTVPRLAAQFTALLGAALDGPDTPVAALPVAVRPRTVHPDVDAGAAPTAEPVRAVRALAAAEPGRPAVVTGNRTVSYGELWALVEADPTPGALVAAVDALAGTGGGTGPGTGTAAGTAAGAGAGVGTAPDRGQAPAPVPACPDGLLGQWSAALDLTAADRFLRTAPAGAPTAALETLLPLAAGAVLCLATHEGAGLPDPAGSGATAAALPGPLLAALAARPGAPLAGLRVAVATGGDPVRLPGAEHLRLVRALGAPGLPPLPFADLGAGPRGPLVPDPGTGAALLDPAGREVLDGSEGELYVAAGPGADPLATGLAARRLPGDRLELLGPGGEYTERDGYRVRLADVEWALTAHPAVHGAVVTTGPNGTITAYAGTTGAEGDEGVLRAHLRRTLPGFTTPDTLVVGERLPLTPDGRIDRASARLSGGDTAP